MTATRAIAAILALTAASLAHAEIFKCTDGSGRITYTNDQSLGRGCKALDSDLPVSSVPAPKAPAAKSQGSSSQATPANFPRISAGDQRARDDTRRQVLEQELADEEKALAGARSALAEQETATPQAPERLQPFKDRIELHQRNIEALRREIANLK